MNTKYMAIARLLAAAIAFTSALVCPGAETNFFFFRGPEGLHSMDSVGVNTNGPEKVVYFIGGDTNLFRLVGTNSTSTNVAQLVPGNTYVSSISRDGQYFVGRSGNQAAFWNSSTPHIVIGLGIPAGRSSSEASGVSSGPSPTVVGFAGTGSFVWKQETGIQSFANPSGHFSPGLTGISADGQTIVGFASGTLTSIDPLVSSGGSNSFLDESGGNDSIVKSISSDGSIFGGDIDEQGAIWNDGVALRLTLDGSPVGQVQGVSDNGFAVGTTTAGGYIYDPRTGLTSLFDAWWESETGAPIVHHVTGINDIYWDGTDLFFALNGSALLANVSVGSVPEPASVALLVVAILFCLALKKSQKQQTHLHSRVKASAK